MIIDWLDKGPIDLEYKQYRLLSYLKGVDDDWDRYMLYPHLTNIIEYAGILSTIVRNKNLMDDFLPKEIIGVNLEKREIIYERLKQPNIGLGDNLDVIVNWGLEILNDYSQIGIVIYEDISEDVLVSRVGIESLISSDGYIIFESNVLHIYEYHIGNVLIDVHGSRYVYTNKMGEYSKNKFESIEDVKLKIIKDSGRDITNCFSVKGFEPYPIVETILPIVKRKVLLQTTNKDTD